MSQKFAMDYIDVAARIVEFREKYPDGRLRPADPATPYRIESIGGEIYIVVVAAAHRSADDALPGIGMAYEQFPGKTQFTRGSELQNAETSAWGRAIVAALAADTRKGIASAEEVRNRQAERDESVAAPETPEQALQARIVSAGGGRGYTPTELLQDFASRTNGKDPRQGTVEELRAYLTWLEQQPAKEEVPA